MFRRGPGGPGRHVAARQGTGTALPVTWDDPDDGPHPGDPDDDEEDRDNTGAGAPDDDRQGDDPEDADDLDPEAIETQPLRSADIANPNEKVDIPALSISAGSRRATGPKPPVRSTHRTGNQCRTEYGEEYREYGEKNRIRGIRERTGKQTTDAKIPAIRSENHDDGDFFVP